MRIGRTMKTRMSDRLPDESEISFSHREKMREARKMRASFSSRSRRSMRIIPSTEVLEPILAVSTAIMT